MLLRMTSCNNPTSVGNRFVGSVAQFNYNENNFTFGSMYSSTVNSIVRTDNIITIETQNTTYVLEDNHE